MKQIRQPMAPEERVIDAVVVRSLADRVEAGKTVDADLTDGTFSALIDELARRGFVLMPRSDSDPVKWLKPFSFRVVKHTEQAPTITVSGSKTKS